MTDSPIATAGRGDVSLLADAPATAEKSDAASVGSPVPDQYLPTWLDYRKVSTDLGDDGVSAPEPLVEGLRGVVADAASQGIDLKVVYTDAPAAVYTQARDLATILGQEHHGTIMVRTPLFVGSVSDTVPRARLEAGQDDAYKQVDPVTSAVVFEHAIARPAPPWAAYSAVVLLALVAAVAVFVVLLRRRSSR